MSPRDVTDELARQISADLRDRYALDDADILALGVKLAGAEPSRQGGNVAFAERFTDAHRGTFDRLAQRRDTDLDHRRPRR